jgi:hypothetical protein
VELQLQTFFTIALYGDEWSISCPSHFRPRERAPGAHWIGGWVGPRASLNVVMKRKIPIQDSIQEVPFETEKRETCFHYFFFFCMNHETYFYFWFLTDLGIA